MNDQMKMAAAVLSGAAVGVGAVLAVDNRSKIKAGAVSAKNHVVKGVNRVKSSVASGFSWLGSKLSSGSANGAVGAGAGI